jgi:hypothetical protein
MHRRGDKPGTSGMRLDTMLPAEMYLLRFGPVCERTSIGQRLENQVKTGQSPVITYSR